MPVHPILPQFALACGSFVRQAAFPRPFAALDWCPRCGQPDWAHQAGDTARLALLDHLDDQRMSDMLRYLCEYSPATFDILADAVTATTGHPGPPPEDVVEPFCLTCGDCLTISPADGLVWRHYWDTPDGRRLYVPSHPTTPGWREPAR
jgi:hypothetical protein